MNVVIYPTLHIYSSLVSTRDYFLGYFLDSTDVRKFWFVCGECLRLLFEGTDLDLFIHKPSN